MFNHGVWQCLDELSDPTLRSLASRLESTVIASRAPGTTDAYKRAFLRWKVFASSKREICALPAKSGHVALYLQHLLDTTHSHSAVDSAIFGIQWAHHLAGLPSPTDSPIIKAVSRAAKRIMGTRVCNRKEPVSPDMIRKLVEKSNQVRREKSEKSASLVVYISYYPTILLYTYTNILPIIQK